MNIEEVLEERFLHQMTIKMVIGWAPLVVVLAYSTTRGFVSHCGWNSMLKSIWHGVLLAT